jgi:outer membrane biosynthesis protein TonB
MKTTPHRLSGLLALVVLVACDDGAATSKTPAKTAASKKAEPVKKAVEPAKVEPAKVEPAKIEPAKVEPAKVEPVEPALEPTPAEPAEPTEPAVEPTDVAAVEPAEPAPPVEPAQPATVAAGDGSTPIALATDAEILKLVLAKDVVDRKPVDPGTTFPSGTKVNLFIESRNEGEADIQLMVTWENVASGRRSPPVGVKIPVRKLNRTRAYRTIKIKGAHRAILIDESGKEIAALPFTIE